MDTMPSKAKLLFHVEACVGRQFEDLLMAWHPQLLISYTEGFGSTTSEADC